MFHADAYLHHARQNQKISVKDDTTEEERPSVTPIRKTDSTGTAVDLPSVEPGAGKDQKNNSMLIVRDNERNAQFECA